MNPNSIVDEMRQTANTRPHEFAYQTSPSRKASFLYAVAGCLYMIRHQPNARIMAIITPIVLMVTVLLNVPLAEIAILVLVIGLVWVTEFMNAAIEAVIDVLSPEFHPLAKVAKDIAAGAVLVTSITSALVGLLILVPRLLRQLGLA